MKKEEIELYGGKANNLIKLQNDFNVPKFTIIDTNMFDNFVLHNSTLSKLISVFDVEDKNSAELAMKLREAVMQAEFSNEERSKIENLINSIREPFAVRSSATIEDNESESLAGAFTTKLFVGIKDIESAIKEVYSSLYSERALEFVKKYNKKLDDLKMAVIIQEMVTNGKYGVSLSNKDGMVIQCGTTPNSVTAGSYDVDTYFVMGSKIDKYSSVNGINILFDFEINKITEIIKKLEKYNFPLDVEFALKHGEVYILQERRFIGNLPFYNQNKTFEAFPASPGIARGKAIILKHNENINALPKGKDKILVAEEIELSIANLIKEYSGVCIEVPGITAHAAIYARELGVPCIVGAFEITNKIDNGDLIEINGSTGSIKVLNKPGLTIGGEEVYYRRFLTPYSISYKDLKQYRYGKDMILLLERNDDTIMFHVINTKDRIMKIVPEISKQRDKPVVEGTIDVWYAYSNVLELSNMDNSLLEALDKAYRIAKEGSMDEIKDYVFELIKKGNDMLTQAMNIFDEYKATNNTKKLIEGFIKAHLAEAYSRIGSRNILYEFIEERAERDSSMLKFAKVMEDDQYINNSTDNTIKSVGQWLDLIKKKYSINYPDYSSIFAIVDDIASSNK